MEAFEPNPYLAARLSSAGLKNVSVHRAALSDNAGYAYLVVPPHRRGGFDDPGASFVRWDSGMEGCARHSARLITLDSFGFDDVDLIKIDVEGHEEAVLDGPGRPSKPAALLSSSSWMTGSIRDARHAWSGA